MANTGELLAAYRLNQDRRNLTGRSSVHRERSILLLLEWVAPTGLLKVTYQDIEGWLDSRGVGPRTRRWHLSNVAAFYRWAVLEGHIAIDPTVRVSRPRLPRLVPRPWLEGDFARAVREADPRMRCFLMLAGFAGMRCCEMSRLRREHIFDATIPAMLVVHNGKGGHQRLIPLHPLLLAALRTYGLPKRGWVFPGQDGPLKAHTISRYVALYLDRLGIEATAHQGRHAFATAVYRASKDLRMVQELLGHASPATTATYAGFHQPEAVAVVTKLGLGPTAA